LAHLIIESNHKNTFRTTHEGIYSKLIGKQWGVAIYLGTPKVKYPNFDPKMTPNIEIMQITSQFEPFDHAR